MCGFCELRSSSPAGALLGHVAEPFAGACAGRAAFLPSARSLRPALAAAVPAVPCERFLLPYMGYWQKGSRTVRNSTWNLNRGGQSCLGHLAWSVPVEGLLASTATDSCYFRNCLLQPLSFSRYEIVLCFNCVAKSRKS